MNRETGASSANDIQNYLHFMKRMCPLITDDELTRHAACMWVCRLKKKEMFIKAGELQKNVGFVSKGLIRSFYINAEGQEITQQFVPEETFASHYSALLSHQPSRFYYQCLEDTTLVIIPFDCILAAYDVSHALERFGRLLAEKICQAHHMRVESFLFDNAEQRYLGFINRYPNLFKRVSVTDLCSYLGMERQTLTRIRKKLVTL